MQTDWYSQSLNMFLCEFVVKPQESTIGFGFLQGLPAMLTQQENESSAMQQGVSAVALMSLAHRSSCFDYLVPEARRRYGDAMHVLMKALNDPGEWKTDRTVATILCLGAFEVGAAIRFSA